MKIYVVSGLGADFKILEKLKFPDSVEVESIGWLIPERGEKFSAYVARMAEKIDASQPFCLLGYSYGGLMVQEINKIRPAKKVVIMGFIRSHREKSWLLKLGRWSRIPNLVPACFYRENVAMVYFFFRKLYDPANPKFVRYFVVKDPYYLKWSVVNILRWRNDTPGSVIQILADQDVIFPIKYSQPDYTIRGASHLFPLTRHQEVSKILSEIFAEI